MVASRNGENIMPFVKPSKETTEKLRGWLILNPNKPRKTPAELRALHLKAKNSEKEKNPESAATGETP